MPVWLEAVVTLVPTEVGGRSGIVTPRDGSYRPYVRAGEGPMLRVRFIEGPPRVAPGDIARVVLELDEADRDDLISGELDLLETGGRLVGIVSVSRVWRAVAPS